MFGMADTCAPVSPLGSNQLMACEVAAVSSRYDWYGARGRLGLEWLKLGVVSVHVAIGGFGHFIPDAGDVAERFGGDQARIV